MNEPASQSPLGEFRRYLRLGQLAFQRNGDGKPVFYPRVLDPADGGPVTWAVSNGTGTVYSTTTLFDPDGSARNVALIDLDEGFRMMSRVEGVASDRVEIGMRVRFFVGSDEQGEPIALFAPVGEDRA